MGSEAEPEPSSTPKLPILTIPPKQSPDDLGMLTPPLHGASASVPFWWEEEPGKPRRPCTALTTTDPTDTGPKCLELPPRLQPLIESKMTKMPSPTTVLGGPYSVLPAFQSSSFRFKRERQGSFGNSIGCSTPERGQLGDMVLCKRAESKERGGGLFAFWGGRDGKKGGGGGGRIVFSSSMDNLADFGAGEGGGSTRVARIITRKGSFSSLSEPRSHFWATMYKGFKQVLPWRNKKLKKEGLTI